MSTAIEFDGVGKQYRLGRVGTGTLSHDLNRWWQTTVMRREDPYLRIGETNDRTTKGNSDYVWALKDISFKVEQGDVVGIIGKNGAGKSTLLKLLSHITAPTTGSIRYNGRIASLLEVGTGFHPEMTARENIYMNGSIMGMTKSEITRKLDEIVDFAGIERYLDTPVKRFSSGMTVRLGFAVAAFLEPEILVVDEVLAVGDAEFQKKAIGKMKDVSSGEGRTVLFVSHNMGSIRQLCNNAVVLDSGKTVFIGDVSKAVSFYQSNCNLLPKRTFILADDTCDRIKDCDNSVSFISFQLKNEKYYYSSDDDITLFIKLKATKDRQSCRINCTINNLEGTPIGSNTSFDTFDIKAGQEKTFEYIIQNTRLVAGIYSISFSVGIGNATTGETNYDIVRNIVSFEISKMSCNNELYFAKWDKSWGDIFFNTNLKPKLK